MLEKNENRQSKAGSINTGFLRKTAAAISAFFQNDLLSEAFASKNGLLQRLDCRVKLLTLLFYMIFSGVAKSFLTLIFLAAIAVLMTKLSRLDLKLYFKRVWLVLPIIMLVLSIPAATSLFIQGKPLFLIYKGLYLSAEGLRVVLRMSLRVGVSISFGYLLVMTTRWSQLTKSLSILKVPELMIAILDMTYRYIFVLSRLSVEMFEARFLRTAGKIRNSENRKFISNGMAFLFIKANHLSEEIYNSMLCRGYDGNPVSLYEFKLGRNDIIWIMNNIIIVLVLCVI